MITTTLVYKLGMFKENDNLRHNKDEITCIMLVLETEIQIIQIKRSSVVSGQFRKGAVSLGLLTVFTHVIPYLNINVFPYHMVLLSDSILKTKLINKLRYGSLHMDVMIRKFSFMRVNHSIDALG